MAFAAKLNRSTKVSRGRTAALEATPIAIRSRVALAPGLERRIRSTLGRRLGHAASLIERGTVRFEDINGPRGGIDTVCTIKLVLGGRPSVQAAERANKAEAAFDLASHKIRRALDRVRGKHELATGRRRGEPGPAAAPRATRKGRKKNTARGIAKLKVARLPPARKRARVQTRAKQAKRATTTQR